MYVYLALMIKAILFDLDDLMVNSAPLHIEASRRVFQKHGIDVTKIPADVVSSYFGKRVSEIVKLIADYFSLDKSVDIDELIKEREFVFLDLIRTELEPMPGLFVLTERLKGFGAKRAVASSGTRVYINAVLEKLKLNGFFQEVVSGDMVEKGKPAPDIFLKAANDLGIEPQACVVLEDSTVGIDAAKRAGMYCIAVDNSISPYKQDLSEADIVVKRLDEIDVDLLKSLK